MSTPPPRPAPTPPGPATSPDGPADLARQTAPVVLRVEEVTVDRGTTRALDRVSASLAAGGALALIGPNGSGKTTLLRSILGLLPLRHGRIEVLGRTPTEARADVAYVPQQELLDPEFPVSALDVVLMGRYRRVGWLRRPHRSDREAATAALERVGLAHRARDRFGTLSGGQRQRVLIARAIAQGSRLLLLDEPFNGVDTATQDLLVAVLAEQRAGGVAVVISIHDLAVATAACTHALLLDRHAVAFGPVDEVLTPGYLREAYGAHALVVPDHGHPLHEG